MSDKKVDIERLIYEALQLRRRTDLLPVTVEDVKAVEKELEENGIELPESLKNPKKVLQRIKSCQRLDEYFGLSYASYLVVPRIVLNSMPEDWQNKFVDLLNELNEWIDFAPPQNHEYRVTLWKTDEDGDETEQVNDRFRHYRHEPPLPLKKEISESSDCENGNHWYVKTQCKKCNGLGDGLQHKTGTGIFCFTCTECRGSLYEIRCEDCNEPLIKEPRKKKG